VSDNRGGLPIGEAAKVMGLTVEAVRKRLKRSSLTGYKVDEEWRVIVPDDPEEDTGPDPVAAGLIEALKAHIASLERELAEKDRQLEQRAREVDRFQTLIQNAQQVQMTTLKALPASQAQQGGLFSRLFGTAKIKDQSE
jgi:hypothetical protein